MRAHALQTIHTLRQTPTHRLPGVLESVFRRPADGALLQLYINGCVYGGVYMVYGGVFMVLHGVDCVHCAPVCTPPPRYNTIFLFCFVCFSYGVVRT